MKPMRILWIVNTVFPEPARELGIEAGVSGGWMHDFASMAAAQEGVELAVAAFYDGSDFRELTLGNIRYFLLPGGGRRMLLYHRGNERLWAEVVRRFAPTLVHLHGTEYAHGLAFLRAFPQVTAVVSVQGILTRIAQEYFGGLRLSELVRYRTLRENLRLNGMLEQKLLLGWQAGYEREILRRVCYAHVVNAWDASVTGQINERLRLFRFDFNLRPAFYGAPKWNPDGCGRYTVLTGQCVTPLKGLHVLLRAFAIVRRKCPEAELDVAGNAPSGGYGAYIASLLRREKLEGCVHMIGPQDERGMLESMLRARLVVVPSALEGTSMFLREAAYLGVPCISAFRGGMADFLRDGESGFLYDYPEFPYLAQRMLELLGDDALSLRFSQNGIRLAEERHHRERNFRQLLSMYDAITSESGA